MPLGDEGGAAPPGAVRRGPLGVALRCHDRSLAGLHDACGRIVIYPTKYEQVRVALPHQAFRGPRVPIISNEGLGTRDAPPQRESPQGRDRRRSYGNLAPLVAILGDDRV